MRLAAERVKTPQSIQGAIRRQNKGRRLMSYPTNTQQLEFPPGLVRHLQRSWGEIKQVVVIKNHEKDPPVQQRIHLDSSRSFEIIVDPAGADFVLLVSEKGKKEPVERRFHFPQYTLLVFNTFHAGAEGTTGCKNVRIHGYLGAAANEDKFGQRYYEEMLRHARECQDNNCMKCKERDKLMPPALTGTNFTQENICNMIPSLESVTHQVKKM